MPALPRPAPPAPSSHLQRARSCRPPRRAAVLSLVRDELFVFRCACSSACFPTGYGGCKSESPTPVFSGPLPPPSSSLCSLFTKSPPGVPSREWGRRGGGGLTRALSSCCCRWLLSSPRTRRRYGRPLHPRHDIPPVACPSSPGGAVPLLAQRGSRQRWRGQGPRDPCHDVAPRACPSSPGLAGGCCRCTRRGRWIALGAWAPNWMLTTDGRRLPHSLPPCFPGCSHFPLSTLHS